MKPFELIHKLDKIKIPENFLLLKSITGALEHQQAIWQIQEEVDKYLKAFADQVLVPKEKIDEMIPPVLRKKFHKGDWNTYINSVYSNGDYYSKFEQVHRVIIDFEKYKIVPCKGDPNSIRGKFEYSSGIIDVIMVDRYYWGDGKIKEWERSQYDQDYIYHHRFATTKHCYYGYVCAIHNVDINRKEK